MRLSRTNNSCAALRVSRTSSRSVCRPADPPWYAHLQDLYAAQICIYRGERERAHTHQYQDLYAAQICIYRGERERAHTHNIYRGERERAHTHQYQDLYAAQICIYRGERERAHTHQYQDLYAALLIRRGTHIFKICMPPC